MKKRNICLFVGFLAFCIGIGINYNDKRIFDGDETIYNFDDINKQAKLDTSIISNEWNSRMFGRFQSNSTNFAFNVDENTNGVELKVGDNVDNNNFPKLVSNSESLLYYYQEINASDSFELTATMTVNDCYFENLASSQTSAISNFATGLMVRDDICLEAEATTSSKKTGSNIYYPYQDADYMVGTSSDGTKTYNSYRSNYLALGNFGFPYKDNTTGIAWVRDGLYTDANRKKKTSDFIPADFDVEKDEDGNITNNPDDTNEILENVKLSMSKNGNKYSMKYVYNYVSDGEEKTYSLSYSYTMTSFTSKNLYVGLFLSGPMKVTFKDISFKIVKDEVKEEAGASSYVGYQLGDTHDLIRFIGKVYVGSTDEEFASFIEQYRALEFTIYAQIDGANKYAKLETTGLMTSINNGESVIEADEGWYFFGVIIKGIPEDTNFKVFKVETAVL